MKIYRAVSNGLKEIVCPLVIATSMLLTIVGCAGNGEGLDANGRPIGDTTVSVALSADFQSIQANVFTPICSVCHVGGGAPMGLRLDAADSYNLLVGVPSTEVPTIFRVKPGDPDGSYLIQKLEGHAAVGVRMPFGGPYLSSDTIAFIRQWITAGAAQSATASSSAMEQFSLLRVVPDASEPVSQSPPQITAAFNHEIDIGQIDLHSARIEKMDLASGKVLESIAAAMATPIGNTKVLMISPAHQLPAGHYQVLMRTAVSVGMADTEGHTAALGPINADGEFIVSTFDVEVLP